MVLIATPVLAAVDLEVNYPVVGPGEGFQPGGGPVSWVQYIFYFMLIITAIAAIGSLVYAGIIWMTSGVTDRISDAKSRIWAAVIGLLIVAGSVIVLETINPDLVNFRTPDIEYFNEEGGFGDWMCDEGERYNVETGACEDLGVGGGYENYQWINTLGTDHEHDCPYGMAQVPTNFCTDNVGPRPEGPDWAYYECCGLEN